MSVTAERRPPWACLSCVVVFLFIQNHLAQSQDQPAPTPTEQKQALTLRESIDRALQNNLDIEVSRYQPAIDEALILAALGPFDPTAFAETTGGEKIYQSPFAFSGSPITDLDSFHTAVGIRQQLPLGPSYELSLTSDRYHTSNTAYSPDPRWEQNLGLTVTVPVLKGAGEVTAMNTYLISRHTHAASIKQFEKVMTDSVFQVIRAYWELVFAIENKKVKEQSLRVAQRLLDENKKKFEVGQIAKIDVIQAEAGVALQQEGILTAENAAQNAMDQLRRLIDPMGLSQKERDYVIEPKDPPRTFEKPLEAASALAQALKDASQFRPELEQLRRQIEIAELVMAKAENDMFPKLDLIGTAALTGINSNLGNTFDETLSRDFRDLSGGLVFELPLGQFSARGNRVKAALEKKKAEISLRNTEFMVIVEVRKAVREIATAEKRIDAAKKATELAKQQLEAEQKKQEAGLTTTFMVLDIQRDYAEAQKNEIRALIDYNIALVDLQRATGSLLEKLGVILQDQLKPRQ